MKTIIENKDRKPTIPRKTFEFLCKLRDNLNNPDLVAFYIGHYQKVHYAVNPNAKVGITNDEAVAQWVNMQIEAYNTTSGDNWKGVKRNTPWVLRSGSGSSHTWVSPVSGSIGDRLMIVEY